MIPKSDYEMCQEWLKTVAEPVGAEHLPDVLRKPYVLAIVDKNGMGPEFVFKVGAALLTGKPLIVLALGGVELLPSINPPGWLANAVIRAKDLRDATTIRKQIADALRDIREGERRLAQYERRLKKL